MNIPPRRNFLSWQAY